MSTYVKEPEENFTPYDDFIYQAGKLLESLLKIEKITPEEIAQTLFDAANDGKDKLRYTIGNEDFHSRISARTILPDQQNIQWIRNGYMSYKKKNKMI